jgi:hypothetical protein
MKNERGVALALVVLILGIVSLIVAGVVVQRQFDARFGAAQTNYNRMFNLADGAAALAFSYVGLKESVEYTEGQTITETVQQGTTSQVGGWSAQTMFKGYETDYQDCGEGYEIGSGGEGFYRQFWIAQGTSNRTGSWVAAGDVDPMADSVVYIAARKCTRK